MKDKQIKFSENEIKILTKIREYKRICESNIVAILYKQPDLFYIYNNLSIDSFMHNEWKVYFAIGEDLILKENKKVLDEVTIGLYLTKHEKLEEKYNLYGGYASIELAKSYVKIDNIEGYIDELNKWNTIINIIKSKFPIDEDKLKSFIDMTLDEIYDEYEALLNHIFINTDGGDKTYDIADGLSELIDELDKGLSVGLPLYNAELLTNETGGNLEGNITLCGGLSGVGKTALTRTLLLPSIVENNEKIVVIINEESHKKWKREMLVWVANNIYNAEIQKYTVRNGHYSKETKELLLKCASWIEEHKQQIILKPFQKFTCNKAIKTIKKYAHMGVKYFILDTYKADSTSSTGDEKAFWFNMQQNMVNLYDTIKEENLNVHLWVTFQLAKSSSRQRFYSQDNIGMAKNIIDVASTCVMVRKIFEDELPDGKHELKVYKLGGKSGKTKIPIELDPKKHYQILFIIKNREGSSNEYQIVIEHDLSKNTFKEVGLCVVPVDF